MDTPVSDLDAWAEQVYDHELDAFADIGLEGKIRHVRLPSLDVEPAPPQWDDWAPTDEDYARQPLADAPNRDAATRAKRGDETEPLKWMRGSDYEPRPIRWLWPKFIPAGELTLFEGKKKAGKSSALAPICAAVTRGEPMPDGSGRGEPAGVVWITGEESIDAVVLRLRDAGADMARVHMLNPESRTLKVADLESEVRAFVEAVGAVLVIVDPIKSFMRGDDSDEIGIRNQLLSFARTAQVTGCAFVVTRHWTKGIRAADERGGGSISYGAVARSVLGVGKDDADRRAVFVIESSNVRPGHAMLFELEGDEESGHPPQCVWGERTMVNPDDFALVDPAVSREREPSKEEAAVKALEEILTAGPVLVREAKAQVAQQVGCSIRVVENAARRLGVVTVRLGFGKNTQPPKWRLPRSRNDDPPGEGGDCENERTAPESQPEHDSSFSQETDNCENERTALEPRPRSGLAFSQPPTSPREKP
jgi:hypothetical protein